jgi:hypothetical protein
MKQIVKYLILAKSGSDIGKKLPVTPESNACSEGYAFKDQWILKAISLSRKESRVSVGHHWNNGLMSITFDIQGVGAVAFHTLKPERYEHLNLPVHHFSRKSSEKVWGRLRRLS